MITKREPIGGGIGIGLGILAVGVAIGLLLQPAEWFDVAEAAATVGATISSMTRRSISGDITGAGE